MPQRLLHWSLVLVAGFVGGLYGATDSVLCTAEFQITEAALVALGTARQNHQVPKYYSEKICLIIGRLPTAWPGFGPFSERFSSRPDITSKGTSPLEALDVVANLCSDSLTRVPADRFPNSLIAVNQHLAFPLWQRIIFRCRNRPCQETEATVLSYSRPLRCAEIRSEWLLFRTRFAGRNPLQFLAEMGPQ